ncbi:hypothetical protein [Gimesia sp.]|uniref:hypothetical protein n=1 Tax=Gimesia sp. TaxID=2024833 RepID=UPI003A8F63E9
MNQIRFSVIFLMGVFFISGCGRSASPPKAVPPMSPEEAALDIVTAIYTISAEVKEKVPQNWEDLEIYASSLQNPARQNALDAIKKIKGLNYKVTWGIDRMGLNEQNANANEYVIFESPDGHLKSTYGGAILKEDPAEDKGEMKLEETESGEEHTETTTTQ